MTTWPQINRYSVVWVDAAAACTSVGSTLASDQDLRDLEVSGISNHVHYFV